MKHTLSLPSALCFTSVVALHAADTTPPTKPSAPQNETASILPQGWNPALAGAKVLKRLINVTPSSVKGAHDAEFVCVGDHAFVVTESNDTQSGESPFWPVVYCTLSIVNLKTLALEDVIVLARGEQKFENATLPVGACFVPRILQKDDSTLRCYFASEQPGKRQSQTWYRDFDLKTRTFEPNIHKVKLKTAAGTFDMQPQYFHADAVAKGFNKPAQDYGLYLFDSFKKIDGKTYLAINNWPGHQNALALCFANQNTLALSKLYTRISHAYTHAHTHSTPTPHTHTHTHAQPPTDCWCTISPCPMPR